MPKVFADGPDDSPHRYQNGSLCMWHPDDPPEQKWIFQDGLLALLNQIQAHLFRERPGGAKPASGLGRRHHTQPNDRLGEAVNRPQG